MAKYIGLFDSFDNLDQIQIENIASWLNPKPNLIQLENYLANKILYPRTLPLTEFDMQIDLAILRETLRLNAPNNLQKGSTLLGDNPFLNITLRKIMIPLRFLDYVPNLSVLTWVFVDGLLLNRKKEDWFEDLWTVVLTNDGDEVVGSILLPQFDSKNGHMDINLLGNNYKISYGSLVVVPCLKQRCEVSYKFNQGKILGKEVSAVEISGGKLGIMIDGRGE